MQSKGKRKIMRLTVLRCETVGPRPARAILVLLAIAVGLGAYCGRRPNVTGNTKDVKKSDVYMHQTVVARVHAGEGYYHALGNELARGGYALRPFFHWRLPTLLWSLGQLPHPRIGQALLAALTAVMIGAWLAWLKPRLGFPIACVAALLLGPPTLGLSLLGLWYFQHELWAGVLIALSLGIYRRSTAAAVVCGLAALAIRELALLYVVIMLAFAIREKRVKEALAWTMGIIAFAAFLAIHATIVSKHLVASDPSDPSWLRVAGWPHTVACANWMFLALPPYWVAGATLVLALFGAACSGETRLATVVILYCAAFAVVGKPFNDYWGLVYSPLLAVGLALGIRAVVDLVIRAKAATRQDNGMTGGPRISTGSQSED